MSWSRRKASIALLAVALSSCGFEPLYGGQVGGTTVVAAEGIRVSTVSDRFGAQLKNNLLDRLTPRGEPAQPRYNLDIKVTRDKEGLAVQRDAFVSRYNLRVTCDFSLFDRQADRAPILVGKAYSIAAFNVVRQDFANLAAERDAEDRAARELANDISQRVAVFLRRQQGG